MRHRFHSICPYFAMFPEEFVRKHVAAWSDPGDWVFDPFSGRGTTVFESLLNGRYAAGCDTNPVAVCVSNAKSNPPTLRDIHDRIDILEAGCCSDAEDHAVLGTDFFQACFHPATLEQILWLRRNLRWKDSSVDCFLAALVLGSLHGESHRTENCLSNRMPRVISTKPDYSVRWWQARGYVAPERNAFEILRRLAVYRFASDPPPLKGRVRQADARGSTEVFPELRRAVRLVITSPPYLDTTNFQEDQWLRLWFLGGADRPRRDGIGDDRHRCAASYWRFLQESWQGLAGLLVDGARIVIRIGGPVGLDECREKLLEGLRAGLGREINVHLDGLTSSIGQGQLRAFRPGPIGVRAEHDFVVSLKD